MPIMPKDQCNEFGCKLNSIPHSAFCEIHSTKVVETETRKDFNTFYKSAAWQSVRWRQLSIAPLCQACLVDGRVTAAKAVDHIFPWQKIGTFAFAKNKFQSLCMPCHSVKTGLEKKGIFRYYSPDGIKDLTVHDYSHYC